MRSPVPTAVNTGPCALRGRPCPGPGGGCHQEAILGNTLPAGLQNIVRLTLARTLAPEKMLSARLDVRVNAALWPLPVLLDFVSFSPWEACLSPSKSGEGLDPSFEFKDHISEDTSPQDTSLEVEGLGGETAVCGRGRWQKVTSV